VQLRSVYVRRSSRRTPSASSYSVVAVAKMLGFTQGDMHDRQRTDRSLSRRKMRPRCRRGRRAGPPETGWGCGTIWRLVLKCSVGRDDACRADNQTSGHRRLGVLTPSAATLESPASVSLDMPRLVMPARQDAPRFSRLHKSGHRRTTGSRFGLAASLRTLHTFCVPLRFASPWSTPTLKIPR
jgi:hypothetical protein